MRANTYVYRGNTLTTKEIANYYPEVRPATVKFWLKDCSTTEDVKNKLDAKYERVCVLGIRSRARKLYVFKGKLSTMPDIAMAIDTEASTVREWLAPYADNTDITDVVAARLWCAANTITYHGESVKAYHVLSRVAADVVEFYNIVSRVSGDASVAIDTKFDTLGTVFAFRGMVLNRQGIAYYLGVNRGVVQNLTLKKSREEAEKSLAEYDVANGVPNIKRYYYRGNLLSIKELAAAVNTEARRVTAWLKDIPVKTDISVLLDARVWCSSTKIQYHGRSTPAYCVLREKDTDAISFYNALKDLSGDLSEVIDLKFANTGTVYTFRGMVLNYAGIAYYLGTATSHIAEKLRGKSREEAELELAQHNSDYIKHPVFYEWEGELLHAATISRRLGSRTNALSSIIKKYNFTTENVYELFRYITDRVQPASSNVLAAIQHTKIGSVMRLYDGTYVTSATVCKMFHIHRTELPPLVIVNTLWCAHKQGMEIRHIFDSLYEFTCPECGRKLLLTSDEIFSFKHSNEFCVGKEIT